jgi:hypothetical protein
VSDQTPDNLQQIEQAQKIRVDCAVLSHAYAQSAKSFVRWNECVAAFSAIVCITYFVLFGIWHSDADTAKALGTIQAVLNGILFCVTVYALFRRWQSKQEFHQEMALKYSDLLSKIDVLLKSGKAPSTAQATSFQREFEGIRDQSQTSDKGDLSQRFIQQGHHHAANTYPQLGVKCYKCDRVWRPEFDRQLISIWKPKSWLPWMHKYCKNCGVKYDE